jgi:UDP-2,3-diacylglucosamine pyrophosphatase LpxH
MKKVIVLEARRDDQFLMISDVHFDNPKCDRKLLKKHLEEAKQRKAKILINGDLFDLMQGKNDRRGTKSDIRPEYLVKDYYGAVVNDAVEFFAPYAENLAVVNYGNHETSITKHLEIDPLAQFVTLMRYQHNSPVQLGDYTGFINIRVDRSNTPGKTDCKSFVIYYHHGFGGGGAVTKGVIQNQRKDASIEGVDCIWMGHVHELYHLISVKESFQRHSMVPIFRTVHHVRTSTYKQESSGLGWHEERGAPPKPLGGYWLSLGVRFEGIKAETRWYVEPSFTMCM